MGLNMEDLTENRVSKMLKQKVQNHKNFKNCTLVCHNNCYIIEQIDLSSREANKYYENLEMKRNAGIFERTSNNYMLIYSRDIELMNGEEAYISISYHCKYISIKVLYKDEEIDLYEDRRKAQQMATEIILPEIENVLNIIEISNRREENLKGL